jgi:hypothetical protein
MLSAMVAARPRRVRIAATIGEAALVPSTPFDQAPLWTMLMSVWLPLPT